MGDRRGSDWAPLTAEVLRFPFYAANGVTACGINVAAESTTSIKNVNLVAFSAPWKARTARLHVVVQIYAISSSRHYDGKMISRRKYSDTANQPQI